MHSKTQGTQTFTHTTELLSGCTEQFQGIGGSNYKPV